MREFLPALINVRRREEWHECQSSQEEEDAVAGTPRVLPREG